MKALADIFEEIIPLLVEKLQIFINTDLEKIVGKQHRKLIIPATMLMIFFFATKINSIKSHKHVKLLLQVCSM